MFDCFVVEFDDSTALQAMIVHAFSSGFEIN